MIQFHRDVLYNKVITLYIEKVKDQLHLNVVSEEQKGGQSIRYWTGDTV